MKDRKLRFFDMVMQLGLAMTPANIKAFSQLSAAAARRSAYRKTYVEVWNEPNNYFFWNAPQAGAGIEVDPGYAVEYVNLLKETYLAIKTANSEAQVGGVSLAGTDLDYLQKAMEAGALPYMDILTWHPYEIYNKPEDVLEPRTAAVKAVLDEFGGWLDQNFTEHGWPSYNDEKYRSVYGSADSGLSWNHDLTEHAQWLVRSLLITDSMDAVNGIELYDIRDDGISDPGNAEYNSGSLYNDFTPKPAYIAISTAARRLMNTEYYGRLDFGPGNYVQAYENYEGNIVIAAWNGDAKNAAVSIPVGSSAVTLTDFYGSSRNVNAPGGNLLLNINGSPQYVTVPASDGNRALLYTAARNSLDAAFAYIQEKIGKLSNPADRTALSGRIAALDREARALLSSDAVSPGSLEILINALFDFASAAIDAYTVADKIAVYNITEGAYFYGLDLARALIPAYEKSGATAHDPAQAYHAAKSAVSGKETLTSWYVIPGKILRKAAEFKEKHDNAKIEGFAAVASAYGLLSGKLAGMAANLAKVDTLYDSTLTITASPSFFTAYPGDRTNTALSLTSHAGVNSSVALKVEAPPGWTHSADQTVSVASGQTRGNINIWFMPPAGAAFGAYTVKVSAWIGGEQKTEYRIAVTLASPVVFRLQPLKTPLDEAKALSVTLENKSASSRNGTLVLTDPSGQALAPVSYQISARKTAALQVPLNYAAVKDYNEYRVHAKVTDKEGRVYAEGDYTIDFLVTCIVPDGAVTIDGDLSDWKAALPVHIVYPEQSFLSQTGLSAECFTLADSRYLYAAAVVHDAVHNQEKIANDTWLGDSMQIAIDPGNKKSSSNADVINMIFALSSVDGSPQYGTDTENMILTPPEFKVTRDEKAGITYYEIAFLKTGFSPGISDKAYGINFCINDSSRGGERDALYHYTNGLGEIGTRNGSLYETWTFK
jgi:hypothetical protein